MARDINRQYTGKLKWPANLWKMIAKERLFHSQQICKDYQAVAIFPGPITKGILKRTTI